MGGVFDVGKFGLGRPSSPVATVHSTRGEKKGSHEDNISKGTSSYRGAMNREKWRSSRIPFSVHGVTLPCPYHTHTPFPPISLSLSSIYAIFR
jgi:hypothetical protein